MTVIFNPLGVLRGRALLGPVCAVLLGIAALALSFPAATAPVLAPALAPALAAALALAALVALLAVRARDQAAIARLHDRIAAMIDDGANAAASGPARHPTDLAALGAALDDLQGRLVAGQRMQAEMARLHDHVARANRDMTADLQDAARLQRARLPATPCAFPGGRMHALYRPSRLVAGDSFDCLPLPDGRTRLFLLDVSGHGAPAAMVAVAAHLALRHALLAQPDLPLHEVVAGVNRDWPEDLPYFTLMAVELDPARQTATLVQCGHPPLLHLPAAGGCLPQGGGGLPIGVLPDAGFTPLTCPFRPGDRLLLATDGLAEATNPTDTPFGEARLRDQLADRPHPSAPTLFATLERALWDWHGAELLEDDVTILVLETH